MKIAMHKVTQRKWIEGQLLQNRKLLSVAIENLSRVPANLASILGYAAKILDFASIFQMDPELSYEIVSIGAQAGHALMQKALGGDGPVHIQVGSGNPIECLGHLDNSVVTPGSWLFGFYFAILGRNQNILAGLCKVPTDLLRASRTRSPAYHFFLVDALKAVWENTPDATEKLRILRESLQNVQSVLMADPIEKLILIPQTELLSSIYLNPTSFGATLQSALFAHKEYFEPKNGHVPSPGGFLAFRPLAFAAMAHDRGIAVEFESDYLPRTLVVGEFVKKR
jgi:Immunity protein 49